jgi:hypothetical protein
MKLFHGSNKDYKELLPASETGNIRHSEANRTNCTDVLFFTSSFEKALLYAGHSGIVYECEVHDAVRYCELPCHNVKKRAKLASSQDIFISKKCNIISKHYVTKKRGVNLHVNTVVA